MEHLKKEQLKKQQKAIEKQEQVEKKRKLGEMQTEQNFRHLGMKKRLLRSYGKRSGLCSS